MRRGLYRAHGVILNSTDYGESDRILAFYTLEHGKIKGIAKGARRSRKRFVGNLEPGSHVRFVFFQTDKSELVRIEDATLIEGYPSLKLDIERLSQACYLLELVSEMTREGQSLPMIYSLLTEFLKMLDGGAEALAIRFFEIKLLSVLGYEPHLEGCVVCKRPMEGEGARRFSSEKGGVVCPKCSAGLAGLTHISPSTAKFLSTAARFDSEKLARLKPGPGFLEESERLLYDFIRFQLGKELKTKRFMEKLKGF